MPSKSLLELGAVTTIQAADRYYVVRGSGDFYITGQSLIDAIGGGGSPGLPVWEYTSGALEAGKFTTDSADIDATTVITFSDTSDYGINAAFLSYLIAGPLGISINLIGPNGDGAYLQGVSYASVGGGHQFTVGSTGSGSWSGDYQMSIAPRTVDILDNVVLTVCGVAPDNDGNVNAPPADTGWLANGDTGSKTAVIPGALDLSNLGAALNGLAAGTGDAFVAIGEKVKALEAAGVANLRPNA